MKKVHSLEKGQIVVLLALALIALLAFTALAIDGGMIYADRRYMQSAADASSIAGAGSIGTALEDIKKSEFTCGEPVASAMIAGKDVAILKADENGFVDSAVDGGSTDNVEVLVTCYPDLKAVDVQVILTHETNTSFVHLINGEPMKNTVTSTTRVEPGTLAGGGYAIVALRDACDPSDVGITVTGNSDIFIIDGGIWSNSCMTYNGTSLSVTVDPPEPDSIVYNTTVTYNGTDPDDVVPTPVDLDKIHDATDMEVEINCPDISTDPHENYGQHSDTTPMEINPGNIGDIKMTKGIITLTGGLYCINGTVDLTGGEITIDQSGPYGVTLYFTGQSFTINGNVHVVLAAANEKPVSVVESVGGAIEDLLIYVPRGYNPDIKLNGNAGSSISGTIFAPECLIDVGGNTSLDTGETFTLSTSLVGLDVKIAGVPGIEIRYDPTNDYGQPALLWVRE